MITASSPGRLDVMGGIADYSGALVLQMPLREQTTVRLIRPRTDGIITVRSGNHVAEVAYKNLLVDVNMVDYDYTKRYFQHHKQLHWASYVVGCLLVLQKEKGIVPVGFDIEITSNVPIGKGVSSSAALEVATIKALAIYYNLVFEGTELPTLAQKVENLIVGAPCGLMDQLASYFGKPNHLLPILCQPDILFEPIALPTNINFVGIDSGLRHSVSGASYSEVRAAAFMGLKIIGNQTYLANISVTDFEQKYAHILPNVMSGRAFIDQYQSTNDSVTSIGLQSEYAILQCTAHPIYEHNRITKSTEILRKYAQQNIPMAELTTLGRYMYESHRSYSACGLGSPATDRLVEMAKENSHAGIRGAKITGGGSGGTVCLLCEGQQGIETAHQIHTQYCQEIENEIAIFEP